MYVLCRKGGYFSDRDNEGNGNQIYSLNLKNWTWSRLNPQGRQPLHRDKLIGLYGNVPQQISVQ